MSLRAYYLPENPTSPPGRNVSLEELAALGWKIQLPKNPGDNIEQIGRELAQKLGFPLTERSIVPCSLKLASTHSPQMAQDFYAKLAQLPIENGCALDLEDIFVVTEGTLQAEIEDINSKSWILVEISNSLVRFPLGGKFRFRFERNLSAVGVAFINGSLDDIKLIEAKDLENHPIRKAYLGSIRQA